MSRNASIGATATALGFGTAVAMWTIGFAARMPSVQVPSAPLVIALLLVMVLGGVAAGRRPDGSVRLGAATGAMAALVNLLILGSVISDMPSSGSIPVAAVWAPGSLLLGAALGAIGGLIGRMRGGPDTAGHPTHILAKVAAVATLLLVAVGGLVTSNEAGLAVVDWPNSYGQNMFLFPLSQMVGGIFYEHAHRLLGSLVGFTTLVLTWRVFRTGDRALARWLAVAALLLVIGQGILGGLRVTGHFTWSTSAADTRPSLFLAMVHGVTGQIFFTLIAVLAAVTSASWTGGPLRAAGTPDRRLPLVLVIGLVAQLVLGVRVRHLGETAVPHMTMALLLLMVALAAGIRAQASLGEVAPIRRTARWLLSIASAQVVLGGVALVLVKHDPAAPPSTAEVLVTTLHQTTGALLLAAATLLAVWLRRVEPGAEGAR